MDAPPRIEVLVSGDCPHADAAIEMAGEVVSRLAPASRVTRVDVDSDSRARELDFPGSPTIRVDGRDISEPEGSTGRLACRTYDGKGVPPVWLLEATLLRHTGPRHVLFLCVANSARSQMAEGIARSMAPPGVTVSSAGSRPASVRPEAVRVLAEAGIDISAQRSKSVSDITHDDVDAVVTLCAEEVCPTFPPHVVRVHWGLSDPAAERGDTHERLAAFREVRDELTRRLGALFC